MIVDVIKAFYDARNEYNSVPMAAYMKNQFPFLGLKKPMRQEICKKFIREWKRSNKIDWDFVWYCWGLPEREFQYLAISYLDTLRRLLTTEDLKKLGELIVDKPWWDTVDSIAPLAGVITLGDPKGKEAYISKWIFDDNIWLKRVSIIFQLKYKEKTDIDFLGRAIQYNSSTREFFVDKAIGWALREYSKTDKGWVKQFIESNDLSRLSVREGSKYL